MTSGATTMTERARPPTGRVIELLDLADRTIGAFLTRITDAENLTREQWRTLVLLNGDPDPDTGDGPGHTMGEIAIRAGVPAPTATRMVDRLVADGLAYRLSDPWDRRRVLVHISRTGREIVDRAARSLEETIAAVFEDVGPVAQRDVVALLERLASATTDTATTATPPAAVVTT
jgi:DNA-binding MarR family transcriptional regulator